MYDRILVPLDGSDFSKQALSHALILAQKFNSELHLLEIVTQYQPDDSTQLTDSHQHNLLETQAHERMHALVAELQPQLSKTIIGKVLSGVVVDLLLEYTRRQAIQLIVMATHGRSGLRRLVFGSVAERVLHASPCPVFLIRIFPPDTPPESKEA